MQEAISSTKQIDEQINAIALYHWALDHLSRKGYGNASFEVGERRAGIVERFYTDESKPKSHQQASDLTHVQHIRKGSKLGKFEFQ